MDRISKVLEGLDTSNGDGLEFGPLVSPILQRPQMRAFYVDHLSTGDLQTKYADDANVDCDRIAPIDVVWSSGSLRDAIKDAELSPCRFDYVVASHVLEHIPDLCWWLDEVRSVIKPEGSLRLILPDRRFTMDIARSESVFADVLAANLEQRRRPGPREIIDFFCNYRVIDRNDAWLGVEPGADGLALANTDLAMQLSREALSGTYRDVHCWVFTPLGFARLMANLARVGMLGFECTRLYSTVAGELDFFVHMRPSGDRTAIVHSWDQVTSDLLASGDSEPELPQDTDDVLRKTIARQKIEIDRLKSELERRPRHPDEWRSVLSRLVGRRA